MWHSMLLTLFVQLPPCTVVTVLLTGAQTAAGGGYSALPLELYPVDKNG